MLDQALIEDRRLSFALYDRARQRLSVRKCRARFDRSRINNLLT